MGWDIPKTQNGFTGLRTSSIAESFRCLWRKTYTEAVARVANALDWYHTTTLSSELFLRHGMIMPEVPIDSLPESSRVIRPYAPAIPSHSR